MLRSYVTGLVAMMGSAGCTLNFAVDSLPSNSADAAGDVPVCVAPERTCGTTCADLQTSAGNCGACGVACATSSPGCSAGVCRSLQDLSWSGSSTASPVTVTAMAVPGTPAVERFDYMASGMQVYSDLAFTFATTAIATRTLDLTWRYEGFHAYFMASAGLQAFADGPAGRLLVDLVPPATMTSAGFTFDGRTSLEVTAGRTFGFIATGRNFDTDSRLIGTVTVTAN